MTRFFTSAILALSALVTLSSAAELTGKWTADFDTQIGRQSYVFEFKSDGDKLTGHATGTVEGAKHESVLTELSLKGDDIFFVENLDFQGQPLRISYSGKLTHDEIKLTRNVADFAKEEIVAKRSAEKSEPKK